MLSGETAMGRFPVEAVTTMRQIADTASAFLQSMLDQRDKQVGYSVPQAIHEAIAITCRRLPEYLVENDLRFNDRHNPDFIRTVVEKLVAYYPPMG